MRGAKAPALCCGAAAVRAFRLRAHHLDAPLPPGSWTEAAGACGVQNSPPGAWVTALAARVAGCTRTQLERALYEEKTLLQAWSIRGVPLVFPAGQAGVFLAPLAAQPGEEPWIYTRGAAEVLARTGLSFGEALDLVRQACGALESQTVTGKDALDAFLAGRIAPALPAAARAVWESPSPFGAPGRQTGQSVGGAIVSFLLRPCAFEGRVVFGRRAGQSPVFTAPGPWLGRPLALSSGEEDGGAALARRFVHCQGPATPADFAAWLGASPRQAKRLWGRIAGELVPVTAAGRACWALAADVPALAALERDGGGAPGALALVGPRDPYLDVRGAARAAIEPDPARQKLLWPTVAGPGAVLWDGLAVGQWQAKTAAAGMDVTVRLWRALPDEGRRALEQRAAAWAAAWEKPLRGLHAALA